jgi:hypothetical protein
MKDFRPGMLVHICNLSYLVGGDCVLAPTKVSETLSQKQARWIILQGQPRQKLDIISEKETKSKRTRAWAQVVEHWNTRPHELDPQHQKKKKEFNTK